MATIATLAVRLSARTNRFNRRMKRARRSVNQFSGDILRNARRVIGWGTALAGVVGGGGLVLLTKRAFATADALAKTADKLGITTEALAGFHHGAKLSGIETRTFDMALQRVTRRISEAAIGTGEAQGALKELGLDAAALVAATAEKRFYAIADALSGVVNPADQVRLAFKLFDSEGVAVINMLREGSGALRRWQQDAEALGLALSRTDLGRIEATNDSLFRLRQLFHGVGLAVAKHVSPHITHFADETVYAATAGNDLGAAVGSAFDHIATAIGWGIDRLTAFRAGMAELRAGALQVALAVGEGIEGTRLLIIGFWEGLTNALDRAYDNPALRWFLGLRRVLSADQRISLRSVMPSIETDLAGIRLAIAEYLQEAETLAGQAATGAGKTWVTNFFEKVKQEAKRNAGAFKAAIGDLPGMDLDSLDRKGIGFGKEIDLRHEFVGRAKVTTPRGVQEVKDAQIPAVLAKLDEIKKATKRRAAAVTV